MEYENQYNQEEIEENMMDESEDDCEGKEGEREEVYTKMEQTKQNVKNNK